MKKNVQHLFFFKLSCFFLFLSLPCLVNAALVKIDPYADFPLQASKQTKTQLNNTPEQLKQKQSYRSNSYKTNDSPVFRMPPNTEQLPQRPKLYDLKAQTKKALNDYQDNELLSKSLNSLSEVKQLWTDADALASNFAYELLFSLELDQLIQSGISSTPALKNLKSPFSSQEILTDSNQASTVSYSRYNTKQEGQANQSMQEADEITIFINKLLRLNTLYYLATLLVIVNFLQWLIPFLLRLFP
ncbi:MAG: hypothetical protein IBX55_09605 [Methyloprofundus sp.]|nr:hypothetical protein [Methyloprofundus sp.]